MALKFYITDWIPELGRYATIIAAFQNPLTQNFIAELFVFTIDKEHKFYENRRIIYSLPSEIVEYNNENGISNHTLGYAEALIHIHNDEISKKTNNRAIVLKEWKNNKSEGYNLLIQIYEKYREELKGLVSNTESDELKKMARLVLKVMGTNPIKSEPL